MVSDFSSRLWKAVCERWQENAARHNRWSATAGILRDLWDFLRDSTPQRRRSRYGDMEYDWEHRVNTTSGSVAWRERLLGVFLSPYQPTDAAPFREMMACLPIDFRQFTFIDLGSGKGRTLLMASEYPFRKIVGVEILPELHRAAEENIAADRNHQPLCTHVESICLDAREFVPPDEPLVLYLFNPLPELALRRAVARFEFSRQPLWIVYHNPLLDAVLAESTWLERVTGTESYSVYRRRPQLSGPV